MAMQTNYDEQLANLYRTSQVRTTPNASFGEVTGRLTTEYALDPLSGRVTRKQRPATIVEQAGRALQRDIGMGDQVERENRLGIDPYISGIEQLGPSARGRMAAATDPYVAEVGGVADELSGDPYAALYAQAGRGLGGYGQAVDQHGQLIRDAMGDVDGGIGMVDQANAGLDQVVKGVRNVDADVSEAYRLADEATKETRKTKQEYADQDVAFQASLAAGIRENAFKAKQQLESMKGPDGLPMNAAQKQQAMADIDRQTLADTQTQLSQVSFQTRQVLAQLGNSISASLQAASNVRLAGAQIKQKGGEIGLAAEQTRLQGAQVKGDLAGRKGQLAAQELEGEKSRLDADNQSTQLRLAALEGFRSYASLKGQLKQAQQGMKQASELAALQIELQAAELGLNARFQNRRTFTSYLSGIAAMYNMMAAPGASQMGGVPLA